MSEIKPALTARLWKAGIGLYAGITQEGRHETAALCLHEQPFGFTRKMLVAIRDTANFAEAFEHPNFCGEDEVERDANVALARIAADRIEALLPPEETHGTAHTQEPNTTEAS